MQKPRIILFDLETLPNLAEALKVWPQLSDYPGKTLRATITTMICAGWKVYGKKEVHCINAWDYKEWGKDVNNDYHVAKAIYEVLKDADAVVTHNGKRFDWKFLQTRLAAHGFDLLHNITHIDTKETSSRHLFSFNNRLGYLGEWLTGDKKLKHEGWDLWVKVHGKDPKAMDLMERYCKQDVKLLEKVFKRMVPLFNNMPNHNLFGNRNGVCPNCGSSALLSNGWRVTKTTKYKRLKCSDCGSGCRADTKGLNLRSI